ncbi:carboxymuconolactone decarboxylase family protein [Ampullimonas aquatilis]|uniref:carboxymuconolactone decarboxylase family protein n=1 Tax=Ampullimonas aquatilis TaxID=1341549 RepID=UPI003C734D6A
MSIEDEVHGENFRYIQGLKILDTLDPTAKAAFDALFADVAPDMSRLIVDIPFGKIYSRQGLTLRERQLVSIAALTVLGTAPHQLAIHIRGGLNVGCQIEEIVEIMIQMTIYAGFPAAINGLKVARDIFEERNSKCVASKSSIPE